VEAALDRNPYQTGTKVSDAALAQVNLYPAECHGDDWNYVIKSSNKNLMSYSTVVIWDGHIGSDENYAALVGK
jgi:hypothetical protein